MHRARAMLLGISFASIGFTSYTYALEGGSIDPDTLEVAHDWKERYRDGVGITRFLEWADGDG